MADWSGQQLGNYLLIRLLARGGFADVYLAEHIHLGIQAAIKVLSTRLTSADIEQFRIEARTIVQLNHPHIIRVLEFGVERGTPFLVMDYAPNGTFRQRYPKGTRLPMTTVVEYTRQAAEALQYAHDQKVIHRDIKPENMLLGKKYELLISDFGIAVTTATSPSFEIHEMAGTLTYTAPEQIQGKPHRASDQYSLGIVVYEWLSGEPPFHGSLTEIATQQMIAHPPVLHEKLVDVPPDVEEVVMTALAKEPMQRFASISAFAEALKQAHQRSLLPLPEMDLPTVVLSPTPHSLSNVVLNVEAPSPSPANRNTPYPVTPLPATIQTEPPIPDSNRPATRPPRRISRRTALISLSVLAGLTVAGTTGLVLSQRESPSSISHITPPPSRTPLGTTLYTYRGHSMSVTSLAWSPDGTLIASASADKTVHIWDAKNGRTLNIYRGHSMSVTSLAWSFDGKLIASASEDATVQVWKPTEEVPVYIYHGHAQQVEAVIWSPDSTRIASGSKDRTVQVWKAVDGSNVYTFQGHTKGVFALAWSPDGSLIASGSVDSTVQVWQVTGTGRPVKYTGHSSGVSSVTWSPDSIYIASGSYDRTVQVWNATDGKLEYSYHGHPEQVLSVAWSPIGTHISSGSNDKTVQVWDATTGFYLFTYHGHANAVNTVAWSPNGTYIASGSNDNTVQVWNAT